MASSLFLIARDFFTDTLDTIYFTYLSNTSAEVVSNMRQMTKHKLKTTQSGFALIEVMVALGLLGIVTLGTTTLIMSMQKSANNMQYRTDATEVNEEMRALLANPSACANSFKGMPAVAGASTAVATLFDGSMAPGVATYVVGGTYGGTLSLETFKLTSMTLANFIPGATATTGVMVLTNAMSATKTTEGASIVPRSIKIEVTVTGGKISSCIALSRMEDGIWQVQPTNLNNIFYIPPTAGAQGNVGIGTGVPAYLLDMKGSGGNGEIDLSVTGRMRTGDANLSGGVWLDAAQDLFVGQINGQNNMGFFTSNGGPGLWAMSILQNGRVGINTTVPLSLLDASAGGIRAAQGNPVLLGTGDSSNVGYAFQADGDTGMFKVPNTYELFTTFDGGDIAFVDNSVERMRISDNGKVGIGTTSPGSQLAVNSTTTGNVAGFYSSTLAAGRVRLAVGNLSQTNNSAAVDLGGPGKNSFEIGTDLDMNKTQSFFIWDAAGNAGAGAVRFLITPNGYVGIGTNSAFYPLQVSAAPKSVGGDYLAAILSTTSSRSNLLLGADAGWWGFVVNGSAPAAGQGAAGDFWLDKVGLGPIVTVSKLNNNVGIGTSYPDATLEVAGAEHVTGYLQVDGGATVGGLGVLTASDRRLKKDITKMEFGQLDAVKKLVGVYYHWIKPPPEPNALYAGPKREIGFIAQDVEKIFPELVRHSPDGYLAIDYSRLVVPVIEAVKELDTRIENLVQEIESLKKKNENLELRLKVLENASAKSSH